MSSDSFTTSDVDVLCLVLLDSIEHWVRTRRATISTWEPRPCPSREDYRPTASDLT